MTEPTTPSAGWDPAVFHRAGLAPRHVVPLLGVSRPTVSSWLNGRRHPHAWVLHQALRLQAAVARATMDGALPFDRAPDMSLSEHTRRVGNTLRKYLRGTAAG